ncbi:MAG TPA: glutamate synthase subunit alpha, partial [Actinomycetales bacterium]
HLAALGLRSLDEAVGRVELLDTRSAVEHWKASGLDLSPVLAVPDVPADAPRRQVHVQDHGLEKALDHTLISMAADALERREPVRITLPVRNVNRTVGTMLGHELTKRHPQGLADDTIDITLTGSAGQSLGAFLPRGITLRLLGDANDYVGKGLCGGRVVVRPDHASTLVAEQNVVAGNVVAYGATSGEVFIRGTAGERSCVRNSGAVAVVEGVGDHALEYMTGGTVLVLGPTGRNVAAGMSGGTAYVLDLRRDQVNPGSLASGEVELSELTETDAELVRTLVARHRDETGSAVAEGLLADWPAAATRFTKLLPRDFRIVVQVREQARAEGLDLDGDEVWTRITEASRG